MENVNVIAEGIVNLAVQDVVNRLAQTLKDKYGIELTIKVSDSASETAPEKASFDVVLAGFGDSKIPVAKAVRDVCCTSLSEAVHFIDSIPVTLKGGVSEDEANNFKEVIEKAGGKVELIEVIRLNKNKAYIN